MHEQPSFPLGTVPARAFREDHVWPSRDLDFYPDIISLSVV